MTIPFKTVAVDMDGTFLNDQRSYDHDLFAQVLNKLEKHNIQFIVASGRPFARLKNDFSEFIDRVDFVTANGSRLIVEGKEVAVEGLTKKQMSIIPMEVWRQWPMAGRQHILELKHQQKIKNFCSISLKKV